MSARNLLAMIAMLPVWSAVPCLAAEHEVGVYLRTDGHITPPVFAALQEEMTLVLSEAGMHLKWWTQNSAGPVEAEDLIVVDLRGACAAIATPPALHHAPMFQIELASTSVAGSDVLPFSTLDCATFNNLVSGGLWRTRQDQRDFLYGRAMARVLAHEFYHVLVHTNKHTSKGVAKKAHSAEDLLADTFTFDAVALGQLRRTGVRPMAAKNTSTAAGASQAGSISTADASADAPAAASAEAAARQ